LEKLQLIIKPTLGIFTNVGTAHNENFKNSDEKIVEKLKLFANVQVLICCTDHSNIISAARAAKIPLFTWGFSAKAELQITKRENDFSVSGKNTSFQIAFPFSDHASIENALHCVALMVYLGISPAVIQERILTLRAIPMRLELKEGINQCQVIDDTYNNDLGGLQISLDFLHHQHQKATKTLILSDVLQSGLSESELVQEIARLVNSSGVTKFIGIGPVLSKFASTFTVP
jgi:alanine racemase